MAPRIDMTVGQYSHVKDQEFADFLVKIGKQTGLNIRKSDNIQ